MATIDVTQAGIILFDAAGNTEVTQAGIIVFDGAGFVEITQAGILVYEVAATVEVTQAGVLVYEVGSQINVTQAGTLLYIEGLHRNPILRVAILDVTSAVLAVAIIHPEWHTLRYKLALATDPTFTSPIATATKTSDDVSFGSFAVSSLTTGVEYIAEVIAVSSAGDSDPSTVTFIPQPIIIPTGGDGFTAPKYSEPVSTLGDRTNLTSIQFCWRPDIGNGISLSVTNKRTGVTTIIAGESDFTVGVFCILGNLTGLADGWYIATLVTRDEFGVERTWTHPGFAIDTAELVIYYEEMPSTLDDWGIVYGAPLAWQALRNSEPTCAGKPLNPTTNKFRQHGDPDNFVNGPTAIGPVLDTLFERGRVASKTSIWVDGAPFGFLFGGEVSENSVYSAVGDFRVRAYFGHALLGPIGFGDGTGVASAAEFGITVEADVGGNTFVGTESITGLFGLVSHNCLFQNTNPTKWPYHLMVEHEVVDAVNGIVEVFAHLGAPYDRTISTTINLGVDISDIVCQNVGIGRFKIDNFQNDNGWGQFDSFHVLGIAGPCGPPPPPPEIPPEIPPETPPIPSTPPPIVSCPVVIISPSGENPTVLITTSIEECPGQVITLIGDNNIVIPIFSPCPPFGNIPGNNPPIIIPGPGFPPVPPILQPKHGSVLAHIPMFDLVANGVANVNVTHGNVNISLPGLTTESDVDAEIFGEAFGDIAIPESIANSGLIEASLDLPMFDIEANGSAAEEAGGLGISGLGTGGLGI